MSSGTNDELEQFRQQWQAEVSQRRRRESRETGTAPKVGSSHTQPLSPSTASTSKAKVPDLSSSSNREAYQDTYVRGIYNFDDLEAREEARRLSTSGTGVHPESQNKEPTTALEHFEHAVEKEAQGNMQASLLHYRRAYKLDDRVDQVYRNKHFPPTKFAGTHAESSKVGAVASTSSSAIAKHAQSSANATTGLSDLLQSFADTAIQPATPPVEGDPPAPCPIASLPREILTAILEQVALADVAALMRLGLACKQLAYLTHAEDRCWRTACWHSRFGFADMHYAFALTLKWRELPRLLDDSLVPDMAALDLDDRGVEIDTRAVPRPLPALTPAYPTFLHTFHARPRVRFPGVYISTVTYIRPGAQSTNSTYWGTSPVHMVTYYRYLRFYRDGTAISLLTTFEPHDVVPLFHKRHVLAKKDPKDRLPNVVPQQVLAAGAAANAGAGAAQPPTINAVMRDARKARWRLSPLDNAPFAGEDDGGLPHKQPVEPEGSVYVELDGPSQQYVYYMQLELRSVRATGVALNTKLAWKSFWSHNMVSDDWAEFNLKNDKAFVFSRVKSWVDARDS